MLVELSVVEQRYHAVMEVLAGIPITEVATRYRVSLQSIHTGVARYREHGLAGAGRPIPTFRTTPAPGQTAPVEALICELRRTHPRWGPRRLVHELGTPRVSITDAVTVHRVPRLDPSRTAGKLGVPQTLAARLTGAGNARRRCSCGRWTSWAGSSSPTAGKRKWSPGSMTTPGHWVIAHVVPRGTGRAVCTAFATRWTLRSPRRKC